MKTTREQAISITAGRVFRTLRTNAELNGRKIGEQATDANIRKGISDVCSEGDVSDWAHKNLTTGLKWARFENAVVLKVWAWID